LGGLWALAWAWHSAETSLRCAGISGTSVPYPSIVACIVSEISGFIRTDGQTVSIPDQEYIHFMGSETLPSVTYSPTNLVYPFTLRVTGIKIHKFIVISCIRAIKQ